MCKPVKCPQCGHEFTPERAIKSGAWTPEDDSVTGAEKDKIKFPKPGEQFEYNGVKFTALGEEQGGIGKQYGFEIIEILLVAHGGWHNDTIVTVERKREHI